jgi:hypothetical protein
MGTAVPVGRNSGRQQGALQSHNCRQCWDQRCLSKSSGNSIGGKEVGKRHTVLLIT